MTPGSRRQLIISRAEVSTDTPARSAATSNASDSANELTVAWTRDTTAPVN